MPHILAIAMSLSCPHNSFMSDESIDLETARQEYIRRFPSWQRLLTALQSHLSEIFKYNVQIQARIKTWESISDKLIKKRNGAYKISQVTDILGIRILVKNAHSASKVLNEVDNIFQVKERIQLEDAPSYHIVASLGPELALSLHMEALKNQVFELQIRTAFAQALFDLLHERHYKEGKAKSDFAAALSNLRQTISEFRKLLSLPDVHEKRHLHSFLEKRDHQFLLHPNPEKFWSEISIGLGTQYRMDFLIREANGDYIVVEIENPKHQVITKSGDISAPVNHARQQVEDWQEWIEDNLPTVQRTFPDMSAPKGLIIIGRSENFTRDQRRKLARHNINLSGRIKILTYDDVIAGGRTYIASLEKSIG
jgi:ppGpp synthetase/RelA/SpoT-type nucleotidyltranferase